jgi:hypothetical protein
VENPVSSHWFFGETPDFGHQAGKKKSQFFLFLFMSFSALLWGSPLPSMTDNKLTEQILVRD